MNNKEFYEGLQEQTQHAIDLIMTDNQKYMDKIIRRFLSEKGYNHNGKSIYEIKEDLDNMGLELVIQLTNLNIEEKNVGHVAADQVIRLKLRRKLVA